MKFSLGGTERFCHTSLLILRFSISRFQNHSKTTVISILFEESLRCDGAFLSHVLANIKIFDFKVSESLKYASILNTFKEFIHVRFKKLRNYITSEPSALSGFSAGVIF